MYGILKDDEPKFKVGDRVRVVKDGSGDGGSHHYAKIGDTFTLREWAAAGEFWRTSGPDFYPHEVAPAFLPGDKVRVTRHSGYFATGDEGEVERQTDKAVFVKHGAYQRVGLPIDADALELLQAAEQQPEPKFKAGDVVRCLDSTKGQFTKGKTYTVREDVPDDGLTYVGVVCDDSGSTSNGWSQEFFELAADCPQGNVQQPCIVALTRNGQPLPATHPYIHSSVALATAEAERLAKNNPGQEFAVYQRVAGRVAEVSYSMKEVA